MEKPMARPGKPKKVKADAKRPLTRKPPKDPVGTVRGVQRRLAEAREQLQTRDRELAEAREQQTATAEILRVISSSPADLQLVMDAVAKNATRVCGAEDAIIYRLEGARLRHVAHSGSLPSRLLDAPIDRGIPFGRAVVDRRTIHIHDLASVLDTEYPTLKHLVPAVGDGTRLAAPLLREGVAIGVILIRRTDVRPFTDKQIALLQTFADQAVIAIENVRLLTELQARNRDLTESLEQQTATAEILRVISGSPTDVQPVFDAIAASAMRLCEADQAVVATFDGDVLQLAALAPADARGTEAMRRLFPLRPDRGSGLGRAVVSRAAVHIPSLLDDPEYTQGRLAQVVDSRSNLSVPMLKDGRVIGAMAVGRLTTGPFSGRQVELLKTFADQAVIAIENVRLFTELQTSNRELTTALDTQTATSDILRVISRSQTDVEPVFDTILASAVRLLGAYSGLLTRVEGTQIELAALTSTEDDAALRASFPRSLDSEGAHARAMRDRAPFNSADGQTDPRLTESTQAFARVRGWRSRAVVPLLRHDEAIGSISVTRREPGGFTDDEIALLQTFADQAVIAIENVRLFKELEAANRELAAASQHKSEFLANMSHELRTPLNAIIGYSELLEEEAGDMDGGRLVPDLQKIATAAKHQLSLINDILDLSKIEAGRMELEPTDFDLPRVIDNALTLVRERATRRGITLGRAMDDRVGVIRADERKVKQVLLNLLSNAIKFTPEGGRIDVRASMNEGMVEIAVADTGVGIAPADQEAIFEEFRQVGTAEKKVEGTGLGLALARKFVELHGGRMWVTSQVGHGSTFAFTLPVHHEG
jgi:signal transduction histidine kinase